MPEDLRMSALSVTPCNSYPPIALILLLRALCYPIVAIQSLIHVNCLPIWASHTVTRESCIPNLISTVMLLPVVVGLT